MNYRVQSKHAEDDASGRSFAPGEIITDLDASDPFNEAKIRDGVFVSEQDDEDGDGRSVEQISQSEAGATEAAQKLAEESGIDLADIEGSGKDGRITQDDVQAAVEEKEGD